MIGAGIDILLVEGMSGVERRNKLIGRYSSKRRFVIRDRSDQGHRMVWCDWRRHENTIGGEWVKKIAEKT
jgi:hypothetical protein